MEQAGLHFGTNRPWTSALDTFTIILAAISGIVVLVTFFPSLDLLVARQFYTGDGQFSGEAVLVSQVLRYLFMAIYIAACVACVAGLILTRSAGRSLLSFGFSKWLFLALCLSVGPGLVANVALKDQFGRSRPREVTEFGGSRQFSPALAPAKECVRNCSFVCGESSSIFALFFAGACLMRRRSVELIIAGLAAGSAAGLVRMSQGAHFLSDVVYSAVFMALTVAALKWLFDATAGSVHAEHDYSNRDVATSLAPFSLHEVPSE